MFLEQEDDCRRPPNRARSDRTCQLQTGLPRELSRPKMFSIGLD